MRFFLIIMFFGDNKMEDRVSCLKGISKCWGKMLGEASISSWENSVYWFLALALKIKVLILMRFKDSFQDCYRYFTKWLRR